MWRAEGAEETQTMALPLVPLFRERLLGELERAELPPRRRIAALCSITGRRSPSVRRWLDPHSPGLPDLESFARLCQRLGVAGEYLLGLSSERHPTPDDTKQEGIEACVQALCHAAAPLVGSCEPMVMQGDDMEPRIRDRDLLFVDRQVRALAGNGTYVVEYLGRTMVRIIEDRLSEGLVLRCANERYADVLIPAKPGAEAQLQILGKVVRRLRIESV